MSAAYSSVRSCLVSAPKTRSPFPRAPLTRHCLRSLSTSLLRSDVLSELDKQLNPREVIERKRKAFEEKYGEKLKERVRAEGVQDLDALKKKVFAPSVKAAIRPTKEREALKAEREVVETAVPKEDNTPRTRKERSQSQGDRSGVKPLSSILNLPLLHLTPHDADAISKIWTTFHTAHPTLASSYLSASLPASTYNSMVSLAQADPFFILPLPRNAASDESGAFKTDEYEMFYLQWLFHPTSTSSAPPSPDANPEPLPPLTSVIFTPLEEFKTAGEWASPHLVLTHYPDLAHTHNTVLMRGEISAASAGGPPGSLSNPGYLLSQQQAQLLALALQRFYCAGIVPLGESEQGRLDREKRAEALRGLREKPGEWDWRGLVDMAYGGIV